MSHTETRKPEKEQLKEALSRHEKALKKEIKSVSQEANRNFTNIAFAGGVLAVAYFTISQLMSYGNDDKNKKETEENIEKGHTSGVHKAFLEVTEIVATQVVFTLLGLAKEKLSGYLQQKKAQPEVKTTTTTKNSLK